MQLNSLQKNKGVRKAKRVARGSTRGKTSGRGHKGQKSRAGHSIRPALRDEIKRIPKLRGHGKNRARTVNPDRVRPQTVSLAALEAHFEAGAAVNPQTLTQKGIVRAKKTRNPLVKILANGTLTKKLSISGCEYSEGAKKAIENAGGEVLA